jgi:hypothetical protein
MQGGGPRSFHTALELIDRRGTQKLLSSAGQRQTRADRPSRVAEFELEGSPCAKARVGRSFRSEPEQSFAVIARGPRLGGCADLRVYGKTL